MAKYKRCPGCGQHIAPTFVECPECEADLVSVPVVDEDAPAEATEPEATPELIRRCDCGAQNPPQARKCSVCGEDISDVTPTPAQAVDACLLPEITSLDGQWSAVICETPLTLGREQEGREYLSAHPYVSRTHAQLALTEVGVQLTSRSQSNPTFVNNIPMQSGETCTLADGDEIGLGGCVIDGKRQDGAAYFVLRL